MTAGLRSGAEYGSEEAQVAGISVDRSLLSFKEHATSVGAGGRLVILPQDSAVWGESGFKHGDVLGVLAGIMMEIGKEFSGVWARDNGIWLGVELVDTMGAGIRGKMYIVSDECVTCI